MNDSSSRWMLLDRWIVVSKMQVERDVYSLRLTFVEFGASLHGFLSKFIDSVPFLDIGDQLAQNGTFAGFNFEHVNRKEES